ncbi:hypothetical protein B0T10DRAFT_565740 [Thelonectria olida]|uniref:NB-ARC domain-containing protein n=1 Tax=Thelonectria olida TaxID=1576542 RepID=A0A9P9AKA3_9HYPO|nr:hypothetical protein B0T10DRAFT_565740 [Thelonectria olida]
MAFAPSLKNIKESIINITKIENANNHYENRSPQAKLVSNVPFTVDKGFVGRAHVSKWLRAQLDEQGGRAALVGLGGMGKTQTAAHYVHQLRQRSPETSVFWVHASSKLGFLDDYRCMADSLLRHRQASDLSEADVLKLVYDHLRNPENGKWLLVLDNANEMAVFETEIPVGKNTTETRPLSYFIPLSSHGSLLITTRTKQVATGLLRDQDEALELVGMEQSEALQLLRTKLRGHPCDPHDAVELLRILDHIPLAIAQAAAYIKQRSPRVSLSDYIRDFHKSKNSKSNLLQQPFGNSLERDGTSNSIFTTWQITFNTIRREMPSVADLLILIGFFNPEKIPDWLLRACYCAYRRQNGMDSIPGTNSRVREEEEKNQRGIKACCVDDSCEEAFENDLNSLRNYSLVTATSQDSLLKIHALVQSCTQVWYLSLEDNNRRKNAFRTTLSCKFPMYDIKNWEHCRLIYSHVIPLLDDDPQEKAHASDLIKLLQKTAEYNRRMGLLDSATEQLRKALSISERHFSSLPIVAMACKRRLAPVLRERSSLVEAEVLYLELVDFDHMLHQTNHLDIIRSSCGLAQTLHDLNRTKQAEHLLLRTLACLRRLGEDESCRAEEVTILDLLSAILETQGRLEEAEAIAWEALELSTAVFGKKHEFTIKVLGRCGRWLFSQGNNEKGKEVCENAVALRTETLGSHHVLTHESVQDLAHAYLHENKTQEAADLYRQVLESQITQIGEGSSFTARTAAKLASTLAIQGRFQDSEELHRRFLGVAERALGKDSPEAIEQAQGLSYALHMQKKFDEAKPVVQSVLEILTRALGDSHYETVWWKLRYGTLLFAMGEREEWLKLHAQMEEKLAKGSVLFPDGEDQGPFWNDVNETKLVYKRFIELMTGKGKF